MPDFETRNGLSVGTIVVLQVPLYSSIFDGPNELLETGTLGRVYRQPYALGCGYVQFSPTLSCYLHDYEIEVVGHEDEEVELIS